MKTSNKKTFTANVKTIKTSGNTVKVAIQNAVIQAIDHYANNGDSGYLTQLMDAAKSTRSIRTLTLQKFIQEHANVKYTKIKAKNGTEEHVFKKATGKGGEVVTKEVTTQWFDFSKDGEEKTEVDLVARAKSLLTVIKNNTKPLKMGTTSDTAKIEAALEAILVA